MRAVVTCGHGDRSQLEYREDYPQPSAAADEVVVKVGATALNYHDVFTRRGMPGIKIPLPVIVGSDIAGEIVELGSDVSDWRTGERVVIDPIYRDIGRVGMIGEVSDGGRAEYVVAKSNQLVAIPDGVSVEQAASLPVAYGTAHRMMVTQGKVAEGERVLILGASGGVGVACVQLAKMAGAEVIACASSDEKSERLKQIGADYCINYTEVNFADAVRELCGKPRVAGGGGVDVAINFTGGDTWRDTQRCVRAGGRILTCGATAGFDVQMDMRFLWSFEHLMLGSTGWSMGDISELLGYIAAGKLTPLIDRELPLQEAAEAERILEEREVVGKLLLKP